MRQISDRSTVSSDAPGQLLNTTYMLYLHYISIPGHFIPLVRPSKQVNLGAYLKMCFVQSIIAAKLRTHSRPCPETPFDPQKPSGTPSDMGMNHLSLFSIDLWKATQSLGLWLELVVLLAVLGIVLHLPPS